MEERKNYKRKKQKQKNWEMEKSVKRRKMENGKAQKWEKTWKTEKRKD